MEQGMGLTLVPTALSSVCSLPASDPSSKGQTWALNPCSPLPTQHGQLPLIG